MWVKICANTNLEDALAAVELGADAVGFVFAPSKRQVTVGQVAAITAELPVGVERVGVFAGADAETIAAAAGEAGLSAVQLHGGFDLSLAERVRERVGVGVEVIQTTHWSVGEESAVRVARELAEAAAAGSRYRILVDAKVGEASGGLGVSFDWGAAQSVLRSQPSVRVIVAGGLRPETVREAIRALAPWGVDVASGVEAAPGRKSYERMREFIRYAKGQASGEG